ncbi:MAG: hypothetical protein JO112_20900 [Planctomycetes bacterium]|nr:hypothetical protein [Planctomycetota bacterium]
MKALYGWLLLIVASTGCVTLPTSGSDNKPARPVERTAAKPSPSPGPVTQDQVNAGNAHQMAQALQKELDQDEPTGK